MGSSSASPSRLGFLHNKRFVFLLATSIAVLGLFFIAFWQLGELCPDGSYCHDLAVFKPAPTLHSNTKPEKGADEPASQPAVEGGDYIPALPVETPVENAPGDEKHDGEQHDDEQIKEGEEGDVHEKPKDPECDHFPDTSNVLLIMKTGASEAYSKIPTQLLTNLKCLDDYLVFSDMEQTVAGQHIQDSLDTVLPEAMADNSDFDLYNRQRSCSIDQETCNKNSGANTADQGWKLDKYKNIHMAEKTYEQRPDYDWYLFVDADTYVMWGTLMQWLKQLNPEDRLYMGSVALLGGFPFAQGGSGYVVSQGMMRDFLKDKTGVANEWDVPVKSTCCGDYMFSYALKNATGVDVKNVGPIIHGEKPFTIAYHRDRWCHPIATMHHIGSEEVSEFHAYEVEREFSSPVRFKDIYHKFVAPVLTATRDNWDNLCDDTFYLNETAKEYSDWQKGKQKSDPLSEQEQRAHLSFVDCRIACHSVEDCLQFSFNDGVCMTSRSIKYGHPKEPSENVENQWMSGWDVEKISQWVAEHNDCADIPWPSV
jgi:hypothetical protein